MGGGWTSFGGGAMMTRLLPDGGGHQVGHGVGSSTKATARILGRDDDPKNF